MSRRDGPPPTASVSELAHEALQQSRLLAAIQGWDDRLPPGWRPALRSAEAGGLRAYQHNAAAGALRALKSAYPVLAELVGEDGMTALARGLWRTEPATGGDLGDWGSALPGFIEGLAELAEEPYLADVARLEWHVHCALRAADDLAPVQGLHWLAEADPTALQVLFRDGSSLLASPYPVASIWLAHQLPQPLREQRLAETQQALAGGQGERALVHRHGWRAVVTVVPAHLVGLTRDLLAGMPLGMALAPAPDLFEPWLIQALQSDWLQAIQPFPT